MTFRATVRYSSMFRSIVIQDTDCFVPYTSTKNKSSSYVEFQVSPNWRKCAIFFSQFFFFLANGERRSVSVNPEIDSESADRITRLAKCRPGGYRLRGVSSDWLSPPWCRPTGCRPGECRPRGMCVTLDDEKKKIPYTLSWKRHKAMKVWRKG